MGHVNRRQFLSAAAAVSCLGQNRRLPNVILMLIDDWGWRDLGCYGSTYYRTPNLDRLASQGMRFTQAYSACTVCSPSRAAVMTGKYPARLHITDFIPGHPYNYAKLSPPDWTQYLPLQETTLAEALKPQGYTTAIVGKWHLGGPEFYPGKQGFDRNFGGSHRGAPPSYFSPYKLETLEDGPEGEYLTDREAAESVRFIEQNRERPFFLYLPHYAVHTPLQAKMEKIEAYRRLSRNAQGDPIYAAMIESMDESVGKIMSALERLALTENTLFIITGDNGGLLRSTSNKPLRAGKGTEYEGGTRVPLIVRWPGVVKPGSECATPVIGCDLFPTVVEVAGAGLPGAVDGKSLVPLLKGGSSLGRDALYWHYPHYHSQGARPYSAIRDKDLKLIEWQEDGRVELYDLAADPGEAKDLAPTRPAEVKRLRAKLDGWRSDVGAQMAVANPNHDPARAKEMVPRQRR
jgi:arylsulfatase A-like enzyme